MGRKSIKTDQHKTKKITWKQIREYAKILYDLYYETDLETKNKKFNELYQEVISKYDYTTFYKIRTTVYDKIRKSDPMELIRLLNK